jgi:hypothetical protein
MEIENLGGPFSILEACSDTGVVVVIAVYVRTALLGVGSFYARKVQSGESAVVCPRAAQTPPIPLISGVQCRIDEVSNAVTNPTAKT